MAMLAVSYVAGVLPGGVMRRRHGNKVSCQSHNLFGLRTKGVLQEHSVTAQLANRRLTLTAQLTRCRITRCRITRS